MSPSARPNIALERTGHTTGFFLHAGVCDVWPAAHRGRYPKECKHGICGITLVYPVG